LRKKSLIYFNLCAFIPLFSGRVCLLQTQKTSDYNMSADLIAEYEAKLATVKKFHPGWRGEDYVAHAEAELAAVKAGGLAGLKAFWERIKNPEHAVEQPASPEPDWAVLGPRLAATLKGAQQALRKALPHCPADDEHNGDSVFVGEWLDEVNEAVALLPTPALTTSQQIRVRACQIICNEHPEWGTWGVMEDRGEYFEIHGDRGGRVLFKSEADQSWSIVPA